MSGRGNGQKQWAVRHLIGLDVTDNGSGLAKRTRRHVIANGAIRQQHRALSSARGRPIVSFSGQTAGRAGRFIIVDAHHAGNIVDSNFIGHERSLGRR